MRGFGSKNKNFKSSKKLNEKQLVSLAIQFHSKGNLQKAIEYYKHCIENNINDQKVYCNYAIILKDSEKFKDAEMILRKYISINSIYDLCEKLLTSAKPVLSVIGPNANSLKKIDISTLLN